MRLVDIRVSGLTEDDLGVETGQESGSESRFRPPSASGHMGKLLQGGLLKGTALVWTAASVAVVGSIGGTPKSTILQPVVRTMGRGAVGVGDSDAQSFEVHLGNPPRPGETYGAVGGGGYYRAVISIAPTFEIPGDGKIRISLNATKKVLEQQDPGGLAILNWSFTLMDINDPASPAREVRVIFNSGTVTGGGSPNYELPVPPAATRLSRIDVVWAWAGNEKALMFWPTFHSSRK